MSLESVRAFLAEHAPDLTILELAESTATVTQAAVGHGVTPAQIAKTLALRVGEHVLLLVTRGDARLDNQKAKSCFGGKVKMLSSDEVVSLTGHPIGGVCPFALATSLPVYCDISLQAFEEVLPAAGSTHSAVRISPARMVTLTQASWVDACLLHIHNSDAVS